MFVTGKADREGGDNNSLAGWAYRIDNRRKLGVAERNERIGLQSYALSGRPLSLILLSRAGPRAPRNAGR